MKKIILASASPRRQELLRQIKVPFETVIIPADETVPEGLSPTEAVKELAFRKAKAVAGQVNGGIIIGADTAVIYRDEFLGKPSGTSDAVETLQKLSGNDHLVITGFCVMDSATGKVVKASETTRVFFRRLTGREIYAYVKSGEPLDKAGSYGIQGLGAVLVEYIEGCYFNVVGLPLTRLALVLKDFGIQVPG
ncbi:MAG: septum formation inhibitor Maf [Firmicutes bacterium HGW-Firmicutes-14]|jgi:septum formation protein|nr:MAG: septum formation inhibitor Maf [Firmicutes bacterium HGW-Firmicutes-14]